MFNLLIADDNIEYIKTILNLILYKNENIRLVKIASTVSETLKYIKEYKIDLLLLDLIMPCGGGVEILKELKKQEYNTFSKPKVIIISADKQLAYEMIKQYDVLDIICKDFEIERTIKIIDSHVKELIKQNKNCDYEKIVLKELINLKYNIKHSGTQYILESILYIINNDNNPELLNNLEKNVYPIIAHRYGNATKKVKNNIIKATNNMYLECDINYILQYFEFTTDVKPTPKVVISKIIAKLINRDDNLMLNIS